MQRLAYRHVSDAAGLSVSLYLVPFVATVILGSRAAFLLSSTGVLLRMIKISESHYT